MTSSAGPVAVTGATGFIGRRLCARLGSEKRTIRALARTPQRAEPGIEWIAGDLADRAALERLVADAPVVVHLAGAVRGASAAAFQRPNVEGVRNLLAVLAQVNPSARLLHVSTLAAREPQLSF